MKKHLLNVPRPKSNIHSTVKKLLQECYPGYTILEEQPLQVWCGGRKSTLFVDLVIKELSVCVECHGVQHFKYVEHFHKSEAGFLESKKRDAEKEKSITEAGFGYVQIRYDEYESLTKEQIGQMVYQAIIKCNKGG